MGAACVPVLGTMLPAHLCRPSARSRFPPLHHLSSRGLGLSLLLQLTLFPFPCLLKRTLHLLLHAFPEFRLTRLCLTVRHVLTLRLLPLRRGLQRLRCLRRTRLTRNRLGLPAGRGLARHGLTRLRLARRSAVPIKHAPRRLRQILRSRALRPTLPPALFFLLILLAVADSRHNRQYQEHRQTDNLLHVTSA
jgi:hypothetical protein